MKSPSFGYVAPASTADVVDALTTGSAAPGGAVVLAGGQSLLVELHHRRVRPALVVDLGRVGDLGGLAVAGGELHVGALARHRDAERPGAAPGPLGRLLPRVAEHVAHPPVRARGTIAGSLAWGHPAAEWGAVAVALDARVDLRGAGGGRSVAAADWFRGPHRTARRPDELVTALRLPLPPAGAGVGFVEHRRTAASYAGVAVVAVLELEGPVVTSARLGVVGAADRPERAAAAEGFLRGAEAGEAAFARAGELAARDADPVDEPHQPADHRRHLVGVLVRRALGRALADRRSTDEEEDA
ncbi:FAD binding domain-containing protein [Kineococcus glutinatus]|uniref:Xanthine dehydrogenase family protein subunit M n=1 Tax=Kineococcus glutinatus TaxID=1070872 RepID=A0ABP9I1T5_9ACTN